ncbi:hypothetical protein RMATCC62417_02356 [Rhizopus microsporus]|nr:hypothetical protein RMATCC62417_02356 [Rhizopus microsporus]
MISRCSKYRNTYCYLWFIRSHAYNHDASRSINKNLVYMQFISWASKETQQSLAFRKFASPNEVDDRSGGILFILLFLVFTLYCECDVLLCKNPCTLNTSTVAYSFSC